MFSGSVARPQRLDVGRRRMVPPPAGRRRSSGRGFEVVVVVALVDDVPPRRLLTAVGLTHASSVMPVVRRSDGESAIVTSALVPLNDERVAELADVVHVAFVIVPLFPWPETSVDRRPCAFVERVRRDQVRIGRQRRRGRDVRVRPEISGGILGRDHVAVARVRAERRVGEARAGDERAELVNARAAGALAALDAIAGDADVVGRRAPRDVDLGAADRRRGQRARRRRRRRVRRQRRGAARSFEYGPRLPAASIARTR